MYQKVFDLSMLCRRKKIVKVCIECQAKKKCTSSSWVEHVRWPRLNTCNRISNTGFPIMRIRSFFLDYMNEDLFY